MKRAEEKVYQEICNEEEYKKLFEKKNDILYIIDVYTQWCGPCVFTFEIINKIYKTNFAFSEGVKILAVCAQTISSLKNYDNNSKPFYIILKNGEIIRQIQGCNTPHIFSLIDEHLTNVKMN
ncbi:thioredoxin-like protein [Plasmodium gonderi]|uniref:Thioredoxin-like protein n=1 Tax=Plasmodium gonderi TaxID=77519 RepID=A0A1Y1JLY6_PLAGO|nr:thioredoxin-like protein [Plasmodium gonderi]GAW82465.1 thioredoxin-like protein [Plasmodium gonderi]